MKTQILFILIAIIAGAVLPFQAGLNIQLGKAVHNPIFAAFASFLVGTVALFAYLLIIRFDFSMVIEAKTVSLLVWLAGFLGAFYVGAVIFLAPKLGVALTFALVVSGQMIISVMVDHFGLMGLHVQQINWPKVLGVVLLISGVIIIRKF